MNDFYSFIIENILRFYKDPFSTDLYNESLYGTIGIITILSALVFNLVFYYLINRPTFSKWYHWLFICLLHLSVCFFCAYFVTKDTFDTLFTGSNPYAASDYLGFAFINLVSAFVFFILWMLIVRWKSSNAKTTPFPH
ncbi:MAG: hypothetical protein JWQ09_233 [Segetibacter sp.]|nr:hypothetical protein [Segetibacter sp.]